MTGPGADIKDQAIAQSTPRKLCGSRAKLWATSGPGATASSASGAVTVAGRIPEETAGPYPGDGTNGPNALSQPGIVRSDIRGSVGTGSARPTACPSRSSSRSSTPTGKVLPGAAVHLWHCDRIGRYSMYASGLGSENYLRGVQAADANGALRFTSVFPGAYDGRWPHIHFHLRLAEPGHQRP